MRALRTGVLLMTITAVTSSPGAYTIIIGASLQQALYGERSSRNAPAAWGRLAENNAAPLICPAGGPAKQGSRIVHQDCSRERGLCVVSGGPALRIIGGGISRLCLFIAAFFGSDAMIFLLHPTDGGIK